MTDDDHAVRVQGDALCALLQDRERLESATMLAASHVDKRVRDMQRISRLMHIMKQPDVGEGERRMMAEILEGVCAEAEARADAALIASVLRHDHHPGWPFPSRDPSELPAHH
jgi:hypothetical protein